MEKLTKETEAILLERFGKDCIIALATALDNIPYVRSVDAFYEDGSFYVLTHGTLFSNGTCYEIDFTQQP